MCFALLEVQIVLVDLKLDIEIICWQWLKSTVFTCHQNGFHPGKHGLFVLLKPPSNPSEGGGSLQSGWGLQRGRDRLEPLPNWHLREARKNFILPQKMSWMQRGNLR